MPKTNKYVNEQIRGSRTEIDGKSFIYILCYFCTILKVLNFLWHEIEVYVLWFIDWSSDSYDAYKTDPVNMIKEKISIYLNLINKLLINHVSSYQLTWSANYLSWKNPQITDNKKLS